MGLSTAEKEGCQRILYQLPTSDLAALYNTVIKSKPHNLVKAELIKRIIEESRTAVELLNRQKVYRNTIMQYLNNQQIFAFANSTKQEAIQILIEYWRNSDSITVGSKATEKSRSQKTVSDTDIDQLSIQITSLTLNKNQEDSNQVDTAELDHQVHQNDPAGKPSTKTRAKATSTSKKTPVKSKDIPCPAEPAPSKSTVTHQSVDSNTYALHISTPGAKPKGKTQSTTSKTTTVSVTISVSEETPDKCPQALKVTRTKKR